MFLLPCARYSGQSVVIYAPSKVKGGRELQLPSMNLLTSKASSQAFFLRVLKVIIQLRDAARIAGQGRHIASCKHRSTPSPFAGYNQAGVSI